MITNRRRWLATYPAVQRHPLSRCGGFRTKRARRRGRRTHHDHSRHCHRHPPPRGHTAGFQRSHAAARERHPSRRHHVHWPGRHRTYRMRTTDRSCAPESYRDIHKSCASTGNHHCPAAGNRLRCSAQDRDRATESNSNFLSMASCERLLLRTNGHIVGAGPFPNELGRGSRWLPLRTVLRQPELIGEIRVARKQLQLVDQALGKQRSGKPHPAEADDVVAGFRLEHRDVRRLRAAHGGGRHPGSNRRLWTLAAACAAMGSVHNGTLVR
jgi:hypothetical protein